MALIISDLFISKNILDGTLLFKYGSFIIEKGKSSLL